MLNERFIHCLHRQHKHEQKDKTKTLVKFPDHVFIDFVLTLQYNFPLLELQTDRKRPVSIVN